MNIQAYIESGKLELFLLGELSDREREEVLALAKQHPEIQKELDEIEEAMLAFDQASAPIPSAGLKEKIMADLEKDFAPVKELKPTVAPEETGKVVKISPWKPFAVAASIVAVIASGLAIYFASKFYETEEQFLALVQEQEVLADNLNQVKLQYAIA